MAESQRRAKRRQLIEQDREFQRKRREFQEDLNARKNEELAPGSGSRQQGGDASG